jgi:hypothetical protein
MVILYSKIQVARYNEVSQLLVQSTCIVVYFVYIDEQCTKYVFTSPYKELVMFASSQTRQPNRPVGWNRAYI